jgi:hypothetical protein
MGGYHVEFTRRRLALLRKQPTNQGLHVCLTIRQVAVLVKVSSGTAKRRAR